MPLGWPFPKVLQVYYLAALQFRIGLDPAVISRVLLLTGDKFLPIDTSALLLDSSVSGV